MNLPECDFCESTDSIRQIGDSKACPLHIKDAEKENAPISINEVLTKSREVDNSVTVKTDLFNAETVSIGELKLAIDSDELITNKPFALATELHSRYMKYKSVIFGLHNQIVEETNKQRAIQIYLNQLANQLRADEREKLKIQDINYKPREMKLPVTAKTVRLAKKRIDKKELRDYAAKLGVGEYTLNMICIQKNLTVMAAYDVLKANIDAAKSSVPSEANEVK